MRRIMLMIVMLALGVVPAFSNGRSDSGIVIGGLLGNLLGAGAGIFLELKFFGHPEWFPPTGMMAGSVLGSALGVHLAAKGRGRLGDALLGSLLGEAAAIGVSFLVIRLDTVGILTLLPFAILPPVGAIVAYRSATQRRLSSGNALMNISSGRLKLGVPDVQIHPLFVSGLSAKPMIQFKVRALSVEL